MTVPYDDPLGQEHDALRWKALADRKADTSARTLGAVIMAAVAEAEKLKAQGGDAKAIAAGLVRVVRDSWPKPHGRTEPWHVYCDVCSDYGFENHQCPGDATCGRDKPHGPHAYVTLCWCAKGQAMKPKPKGEVDELAAVGKTSKPSRFGR